MKKRASVFLLLVLFGTQLSIAAPKIKRGKKTESQKTLFCAGSKN